MTLIRDMLMAHDWQAAYRLAGPGWRKREGYENYGQVLRGIADAVVTEPSLIDDEGFRDAVNGWRFLEHAGSDGEQDLIVSARKYGAMVRNEASEIPAWAQRWKTQ